jgi:hypothetical protein
MGQAKVSVEHDGMDGTWSVEIGDDIPNNDGTIVAMEHGGLLVT